MDLEAARASGKFADTLKRYTNPVLLILDEWLLLKPSEAETRDIFEFRWIERRRV